jgi:hypothetical protein
MSQQEETYGLGRKVQTSNRRAAVALPPAQPEKLLTTHWAHRVRRHYRAASYGL